MGGKLETRARCLIDSVQGPTIWDCARYSPWAVDRAQRGGRTRSETEHYEKKTKKNGRAGVA